MSEIRVTTVSDTAGTGPVTLTKQHAAKAWLNLDGTGTIAINDSFNIASVNDSGSGAYAPSFTNSMSNSSYVANGSTTPGSGDYSVVAVSSLAQGSYTIFTSDGGSGQEDKDPVCSSVHGDLA